MPCGLLVATLGVALGDRILFLPPPIQPFSPAGGSPAIDAGVYAASPGGGAALEGPSLTAAPAQRLCVAALAFGAVAFGLTRKAPRPGGGLAAPVATLALRGRDFRPFRRAREPVAVINEVSSMEELNEYLAKAGPDGLVVVNYSTSWCGPCKAIAPRFAAMSDEFTTVAFLKVMGDSCESADKLMRGQGVRALPSFHLWKNNEKVESIQGAKTQVLEDAIKANQ